MTFNLGFMIHFQQSWNAHCQVGMLFWNRSRVPRGDFQVLHAFEWRLVMLHTTWTFEKQFLALLKSEYLAICHQVILHLELSTMHQIISDPSNCKAWYTERDRNLVDMIGHNQALKTQVSYRKNLLWCPWSLQVMLPFLAQPETLVLLEFLRISR